LLLLCCETLHQLGVSPQQFLHCLNRQSLCPFFPHFGHFNVPETSVTELESTSIDDVDGGNIGIGIGIGVGAGVGVIEGDVGNIGVGRVEDDGDKDCDGNDIGVIEAGIGGDVGDVGIGGVEDKAKLSEISLVGVLVNRLGDV